jgi:putative Mg2+ transporter-C (MgtC) family protein
LIEEYWWFVQLLGAVLLAMPVAWDRESKSRIMGLRTFPLVSLGACAYVIVGQSFISPGSTDAFARIMQGLLSGIGFVGGGAIIKHDDHVLGTASAASIWVTGALGAAVAFDQWALAATLSALNLTLVSFLGKLKNRVDSEPSD